MVTPQVQNFCVVNFIFCDYVLLNLCLLLNFILIIAKSTKFDNFNQLFIRHGSTQNITKRLT